MATVLQLRYSQTLKGGTLKQARRILFVPCLRTRCGRQVAQGCTRTRQLTGRKPQNESSPARIARCLAQLLGA